MTDKSLRIATGTSDFRELITTSDVYVDQTLFIKEFLNSRDKATLITRPRRWGKSLILDLTKRFFALEVDENGEAVKMNSNLVLFEGGEVTLRKHKIQLPKSKVAHKCPECIEEYQGQYPVMHLDLQDVRASTYSEIEDKFKSAIQELYSKYTYLGKSDKLNEGQKARFAKHSQGIFETQDALHKSLKFLTALLRTHHKSKVYVLVDEYDKPVNNLLFQKETFNDQALQSKVIDLLNSILTPCGKGNDENLEKILLIGIFDTVKKTGHSGFSNIQVFGINDVRYGQHFGFSDGEVSTLVEQLEFNDAAVQNIRKWYNGYNIPTSDHTSMKAYTPWAVMNYLKTAYLDDDFVPKSYWVTSGVSDILERMLDVESCANSAVSKKLVDLTNSSAAVELSFSSSASLVRYDLSHSTQEETIFSYLLLNSGYLTVAMDGERYMFSLPNAEVKEEFTTVVSSVVKNTAQGAPSTCRKILDNLNKPKHIKAVRAIRAKNPEDLEHLFKAPGSLRCEDESLNFNYFHLAALYGNEKIFEVLNENCEPKLLEANDAYNLRPVDYAHMLNSVSMSHFGNSTQLSESGWMSTIFCEHAQAIFAFISWATGTTLAVYVPEEVYIKVAIIAVAGIVGSATTYSSYFEKKINDVFHCDNHNRYSSIDMSTIGQAQSASAEQFLKYKVLHQEAYVALGDKCNEDHKLVAQQSLHVFKGSQHIDETFSLSVCEKPVAVAGADASAQTGTEEM